MGREETLPLEVDDDDTALFSTFLENGVVVALLEGVEGRDSVGAALDLLVGVSGRDMGVEAGALGLLVGVVGRDAGVEEVVDRLVGVVGRDVGREAGAAGVLLPAILLALFVVKDDPAGPAEFDLTIPFRPLLIPGSGLTEKRAPLDDSFFITGSDLKLGSRDVLIAANDRTKFGNTA